MAERMKSSTQRVQMNERSEICGLDKRRKRGKRREEKRKREEERAQAAGDLGLAKWKEHGGVLRCG